ncbi:MAG: hypothetical protein JWP22_1100 [Ramlibacter sp.]|nr:hypothetical protein [Ramlibacter sp.]MDB5912425.1 hypothetical protein [Ramlibacter sp.]
MHTVPNSRLQPDRITFLPSVHSFGELSQFLRGAIADEDSRRLSESMNLMAALGEAVVAKLRKGRQRERVAPVLMDMLTVVREHRQLVLDLDLAWRGLYEYAAYLQGLNNLRVLIGQWLLNASPWDDQLAVTAEDFELVAWRTLGDGMLLIDMYEQWLDSEQQGDESRLATPQQPQVERALQWWQKLRR